MSEVGGLAGAAATEKHHGLVTSTVQQVAVGDLGRGIDVRRHIFGLTASEHLDNLG